MLEEKLGIVVSRQEGSSTSCSNENTGMLTNSMKQQRDTPHYPPMYESVAMAGDY